MNDPAKQALDLAAAEFDRLAAAVETEADLWREAAEHARRGEIALALDASRRAAKLILDQSPSLAVGLVKSVERRDPTEWARAVADLDAIDHDSQIHKLKDLSPQALLLFVEVHSRSCSRGSSCRLVEEARRRIGSWRS